MAKFSSWMAAGWDAEAMSHLFSPHRLLPVITLERAATAAPLAEALVSGGLSVAEVTFRTAAAAESIRTMASRGDLLVGAGTVLSVDQVKQAVDAGARFMVSPGCNPKVIEYCVANEIAIHPGVATPTDIELALSFGLTTLKFFPAEALGGVGMLKALSAPYRMIRFIPTGGIHIGNLRDYLALPSVPACGGSWMVDPKLIDAGNFARIAELTREAVALTQF